MRDKVLEKARGHTGRNLRRGFSRCLMAVLALMTACATSPSASRTSSRTLHGPGDCSEAALQRPDWIDHRPDRPDDYIGIAGAPIQNRDLPKARMQANSRAREALAQEIRVVVTSSSAGTTVGARTGGLEQFFESWRHQHLERVLETLEGVQIETAWCDPCGTDCWSMAVLPKREYERQAASRAAPPLRVSIFPDRGHDASYYIGEEVAVSVRSEEPCYFKVLLEEPDGATYLVYPDRDMKNNALRAGELFTFGRAQDSFALPVEDPPGDYTLRIIASSRQFADVSALLEAQRELPATKMLRIDPGRGLGAADGARLGMATARYHVHRR